jgi:signal transduction histidine kinase
LLLVGQDQCAEWSAIPAELTYWGDARRVDQVLVNLLANAHKYAGTGATITLSARAWAGGVRWEVSDDGPPLSDQTLLHLFERYYRAPEVTISGSGLGLSIAKTLVELHGGRIWAENNSGLGCRFIFWLPDTGGDEPFVAGHDTTQEGVQR